MTAGLRAAAALAAVALSGCYTIRWERRGVVPEAGTPRELWNHAAIGGVVPAGRVALARACPDGIASVESEITFGNWLGQAITSLPLAAIPVVLHAPIWEPTTVRVVCARASAARPPGKKTKLVVLPLAALGGVPEERARLLCDALAGELRRRAGVSVVTQADVSALLGVEKTRQMLGCAESGCMAEIGGALGADRVVNGSVGRLGGSLVVNLSALDPRRGVAVASVSERLRGGGEEAFLDALPAIADALLVEAAGR